MRIGINGMGRVGRLTLRAAFGAIHRPAEDPRAGNRLDIVHVNEVKGGAATTAHLLEFDSLHGRWRESFGVEDDRAIRIGNRRIGFSGAASPGEVAWGDLGCDIVLECTGKFLTQDKLAAYFERGVRRVIVAAPVKDKAALNVVVGVNDTSYDPARHRLLTAASCTTNCLAPVVKVVHEAIGIRHGQITTIHDPTNTNVVVDAPHKDLRRARSAMLSLAAHHHRQRHSHRADLSRAGRAAGRPRGPRAGAERLANRLRLRTDPTDRRGRGERTVPRRGGRSPGRHPWLRDASAGLRRLPQRHP